MSRTARAAAAVLLFTAIRTSAHHAFAAEYDENKLVTVSGIVAKFEWTNPHALLYVDGKDSEGKQGAGSSKWPSPGATSSDQGRRRPDITFPPVMLDGRDVLGQAVELSGPTIVTLVLKKDGGTLRGAVEKGGGSTVVLMAGPTAYARFGLTARCDPDGNFSIPDVPPGNYAAAAFQDNGVLYQPDLLSRIDSARGERVKIEAGASETVALKVN